MHGRCIVGETDGNNVHLLISFHIIHFMYCFSYHYFDIQGSVVVFFFFIISVCGFCWETPVKATSFQSPTDHKQTFIVAEQNKHKRPSYANLSERGGRLTVTFAYHRRTTVMPRLYFQCICNALPLPTSNIKTIISIIIIKVTSFFQVTPLDLMLSISSAESFLWF